MKEETNNLFRISPPNKEMNNLSNQLNTALNFREDEDEDKDRKE